MCGAKGLGPYSKHSVHIIQIYVMQKVWQINWSLIFSCILIKYRSCNGWRKCVYEGHMHKKQTNSQHTVFKHSVFYHMETFMCLLFKDVNYILAMARVKTWILLH